MKKQENNFLLPRGYTMLLQGKESTRAFTLVELIVVITIVAILGTIAFISLQGYSQDARDSVRISDISKIKTSLELFQLDAGKYPETTTPTNITYSGAIAWTQGTFGETTFRSVEKLDKIPLDPITDRKYVYSVTNTRHEYEIAGVMEGDEVTNTSPQNPLLWSRGGQVNAAEKTAMLKISGNYNGKVLKVSTGGTDYALAIPSIITSSGFTVNEIIANNYLAYNGYKNLPAQYAGSLYKVLGEPTLNLVNSSDLVVYSGDLKILSDTTQTGIDARKNLIIKLKNAYSSTAITNVGEIQTILSANTTNATLTEFLGATIVNNDLGGSIIVSPLGVNSCVSQPEYIGATYEIGTATEPDQAWQSSNASEPCYWTCGTGKVLDENTCVSETCSGTTPDGTAKVSNATSFAGGTWVYNTTPGKCTYSCGTLYHTEDNNTCISNTKSCTITHGIGEQTWNGSLWGACIATSCTDGYSGTNCEIAPILSNCTANGEIYYVDSSGNKLATVTNAGTATWVSGKSILDLTCTGNIIMCSGNNAGYTIQACNAGATELYKSQTFTTTTTVRSSAVNEWAGGLYQWGNNADISYSGTSTTKPSCTADSTFSQATFITGSSDWCSAQTDNVWGGNTTTSNEARKGPCNNGYHVPTLSEWNGVLTIGGWTSSVSNMVNTLRLPKAGYRYHINGSVSYQGTEGNYWYSSPGVDAVSAYSIRFSTINQYGFNISRASGFSVRCFKN